MKGLPPEQPKFSSFLPQPTSMFSGGSHSQRGGREGALDPETQAGRSGEKRAGPSLFFFASSLHLGSPSLLLVCAFGL